MDHDEVRRLRVALGWTQQHLALELGVTANTVARWERGVHAIPRPTARCLYLLAAQHGIPYPPKGRARDAAAPGAYAWALPLPRARARQ
jgi:transcriptional regulator with XRE-family HTH domain